MADTRSCCNSANPSMSGRETVCIDCNRILDSCRDKDCFENVKVHLTDFGQEIIEKTNNIRVKSTSVISTRLTCEPVQFNRGFYSVYVRFHTKLVFEACVCPGRQQEFEGIAVCEKKVILWGSEGNVKIFKSDPTSSDFCSAVTYGEQNTTNAPIAVCETVDPIALSVKVADNKRECNCCCCCCDIPDAVTASINGTMVDDDYSDSSKYLAVTLGFFSVVRIERPGQYLINASEYGVPDKECVEVNDENPCRCFEKMCFPVSEFSPPSFRETGKCKHS